MSDDGKVRKKGLLKTMGLNPSNFIRKGEDRENRDKEKSREIRKRTEAIKK